MSEILYKICGNKFSNEGFKTIAGSSEIRIEDCEPQVNGLYYYAFRHETAQEVYIMRRYDVKSCDASRDGRMAVAIAIPYGWQLAGGKSPYDLLTELWVTYRDRYMEWGEISRIWKFRADEEDESLFKQLLAEYPLRRFNGRQPMPMRGADCGWQKLNREEDIQDVMRDTRHSGLGLENYSEVVLTVDGNDYRPMVGIRGAYQPQYQVYCNDKSAAVLSSSKGLIVVKPEYDKTCECADDVPITYDEIERARRACPDNDIYEYKSGNATVIVDFVQERIDCKISIEPRQITYQVILGGGSMREIEEQDNVRFLIQDFDIIVGAQLVSVDEECKFTLVGRSISEAISVKLRSGDDRYEVTSDVVSGNNVRYINIYVTRKAVVVTSAGATDGYNRVDGNSGDVVPHVPNRRYEITFRVNCRTQDEENGVEVRFECRGHLLKGTTQPGFGDGKIQITDESFIRAIETGASIRVMASGESYKDVEIKKKDFNKNGEAKVTIDRRRSVFSNQYLLISLFAVAIIGIGIFAYNIFSTDDAPQPNPDTLVESDDNSDDMSTFEGAVKDKDKEAKEEASNKPDESKGVESQKDTSKDQHKKTAPKLVDTVEIGGEDCTMERIVELLKNPKTPFSKIYSIRAKYDNDKGFMEACNKADYRGKHKVSDIITAYSHIDSPLSSKDLLNKLKEFSAGYDPDKANESLWEPEQMRAIQAISYLIKLDECPTPIKYSDVGIDMLEFIDEEMSDGMNKWWEKSLSSLNTNAENFVREKVESKINKYR